MRSEIIFRASEQVENKYKLCQTASKTARVLHDGSGGTQESIKDAFVKIAKPPDEPVVGKTGS